MMHFINKPGLEYKNALAWLNSTDTFAVDTETTGLDPHSDKILLLQIGNKSEQYVFDTYRLSKSMRPVLLELANPQKIKILHNAQFDYKMILGHYGIRLNNIKCTMIAEQLLTKGKVNSMTDEESESTKSTKISASLAAVCKKYLNVNLEKEERSSFIEMKWGDTFTDKQIKYAGLDTVYLIDILNKQEQLLAQKGMKNLAEIEFAAISVFGDMSYNGIYIDKQKWVDLEKLAIAESTELKDKLDDYFVDWRRENAEETLFGLDYAEINYNSPKQTLKLLTDATGISLASTEAKYLEEFKYSHPIISTFVDYKKAQKKITTYGRAFLKYVHPKTSRIHSDFKQIHADTGRTSSANPNMQNIPKQQEYRTPFCVEDPVNYRFISADFSGKKSTY